MAEAKKTETKEKKTTKKADTEKKTAKKAETKTEKKTTKKTETKTEKKTTKKTETKTEEKTAAKKADSKEEKKTAAKGTKKTSAKEEEVKFFEYKGKPLVRSGNTIYYGDINEPYVVCLMIKSETEQNGEKIADDVQVQLLATDETLSPKDRVLKKSEKKGLFTALDLGVAWLERQLKKG